MEKRKFLIGKSLGEVYLSVNNNLPEELVLQKLNLYKVLDRLLENDCISWDEYHDFEDGFNLEYRAFVDFLDTFDMGINIIINEPIGGDDDE